MADLRFSALPIDKAVITGRFGETGPDYPADGHKGLDLGQTPAGTLIKHWALIPTKVIALHTPGDGWGDGSLGNCVVLDYLDTPFYGFFAHCSEFGQLSVGMDLLPNSGIVLGKVGMTGKTTGPHLHWALCKNAGHSGGIDQYTDPLALIGPAPLSLEDRVMLIQQVLCNTVLNPDSGAKLSGDEALRFAAAKGYSTLLSAQENNLDLQELANHVADLADGAWDDPHLRDDLITTFRDFADSLEAKK